MRRTPAAAVLLVLSLLTAPSSLEAAELLRLRHWSAPDHTRVVLDLSAPHDYRVRTLTDPDRVVIDLHGVPARAPVGRIEVDDGLLHRVRLNRLDGPTSQVVLDLVGPRRHRAFDLPAAEGRPDRVVVDVFRLPDEERDALAPRPSARRLVVLDPGHGGDDPGAVVRGQRYEKDIVLAAAGALAARLREADPGLEVMLTRSGDYFVPLRRRYRLAEEAGAVLFVSLHANSASDRRARGAEVYFLTLGQATDTDGRRLAELENASDLVGGAPPEAESDLLSILADLQMKSTLTKSSLAAEDLLVTLGEHGLIKPRSVEQAGFVVLQSARVPSVLVEIGFMSSPEDAKIMSREDFHGRLADALSEGILRYLARLDGR
jgi:N-acetylmuramoyl-L-alanine amidase